MSKKTNKPNTVPSGRPFNIIVKPTGPVCNLACEYCYYLAKDSFYNKNSKKEFIMDLAILESFIKQYISSQPTGCTEVNFVWHGGEPTIVGLEFYKTAVELQKKHSKKGVKITNSLQTNGVMITDEMSRFFADNNFLIGISIDGPEDLHNKYRKNRKGAGSFTSVMRGLEILKRHDIQFNTLTVVQSSNSSYPTEVYSFLKSAGSSFMQFIPIVEASRTELSVNPEQWGRFMNSIFDEWKKRDIGKIFVGHFDMLLAAHAGYPASICVHSKVCGHALAVEHNGDLFSCDHFVFPENLLGNIMENDMYSMVNSKKQLSFGLDKYNRLPEKCLRCRFLSLCFGGCPKNRLIKTSSGMLNYLCEGYRMFYEHTYPYFQAMAGAISKGIPAERYKEFL